MTQDQSDEIQNASHPRTFLKRATSADNTITLKLALGIAMISTSALATDLPTWVYPLNPPDHKQATHDGKLHRVTIARLSF